MTDRRTFNGTIPEQPPTWVDLAIRIEDLTKELRRQQRINRMLCRVIEEQAIKVTVKGVDG